VNLLAATIATGAIAALLGGGLIAFRRDAIPQYIDALTSGFVVAALTVLVWWVLYTVAAALLGEVG
jgi:hypothetical protein